MTLCSRIRLAVSQRHRSVLSMIQSVVTSIEDS